MKPRLPLWPILPAIALWAGAAAAWIVLLDEREHAASVRHK